MMLENEKRKKHTHTHTQILIILNLLYASTFFSILLNLYAHKMPTNSTTFFATDLQMERTSGSDLL